MARNSHSHRHTRLVNYRPKRHRRPFQFRPWYFIPISALAAFILAVTLGNILRVKVPDGNPEASTPSPEIEIQLPDPFGPLEINAPCVTLKGITDNTASNVWKQIPDDATAVSMMLFDDKGAPFYRSAVAEAFGNPCGELTLKNVFKPIHEGELYASVIFPSSVLKEYDTLKAAVIGAYEATLINELYQAGADEVVICFSELGQNGAVTDSEEFLEAITEYITAIRLKNSGIRIGIVLSIDDILKEDKTIIEKLYGVADFCTVDTTSIQTAEEFSSVINDTAVTLLRLKMRLVLTEVGKSEELLKEIYETLDSFEIKNLQYIG